MNATELTAWAAGLFDGRGTMVIGASRYARGRVSHWLSVAVRSDAREPLELLSAEFRGTVKNTSRTPKGGWIWQVMGPDALAFLRRVRPMLHMKARHADVCISFQAEKRELDGMSAVDRHTELARRAAQKILLQQLTRQRRGPHDVRTPPQHATTPATQRRFPGRF
jgi:hypothetical protein